MVAEKARAKAIAVVGAQWGDEGKGKVVDYLASSFDFTARYAGGEIVPDGVEIAEAKFFPADALPNLPGGISIAYRLITTVAQRLRDGQPPA